MATRWSLLAQPHRPCFAAAASLWALAAIAWAAQLAAAIPANASMQGWLTVAHAQTFALGPMPLFIAGFLFTAGPKWLRAAPVPARDLTLGIAVVFAGWGLVIGAAPWSRAAMALGLATCAAGWTLLLGRLWQLRRGATATETVHFDLAASSCAMLLPCLLTGVAATMAELPDWARATAGTGLWWAVVPVFITASHRMLPFFGDAVPGAVERRWPQATLWLMLGGAWALGAHDLGSFVGVLAWLQMPTALLALAITLVSVRLTWRWWHHPARRGVMVAMLHRGLAWWTVGWAVQTAALAPGLDPAWRAALKSAALHALALGFLGSTMLAMVTRVTATHAGRALPFDRWARLLEVLLHGAVVARVASALWPSLAPNGLLLAAVTWAAIATVWTLRHANELLHGPPERGRAPLPTARRALPGAAGPDPRSDSR